MKIILSVFAIGMVLAGICSAQGVVQVRACSAKNRQLGERLQIQLPAGTKARQITDADYTAYHISFPRGEKTSSMQGIYGPTATSGKPPQDAVNGARHSSETVWRHGNVSGVDAKGTYPSGRVWRYFGTFGEAIYYEDVTAEAAAYFDRIIDTICYKAPKWSAVN